MHLEMEGRPVQGGSCLHPELLRSAPATRNPELEQAGWRRISFLFLFIFLKCIYSAHLFQCLMFYGLWVFI